jgi:hypothetical protein
MPTRGTGFFLVLLLGVGRTFHPSIEAMQETGPRLVVAVPNGGEDWPINSAQCIRWSTANYPFDARVAIFLARDGTTFELLPALEDVPNTGCACWRVTGPPCTSCRIGIAPLDVGPDPDMSDAAFTISPARQSLTVTSPQANEVWIVGTERFIRWQNTDVVGDVRIELSRDGGLTYREVLFDRVESSPNRENVKAWRVTGTEPRAARLRIVSLVNPFVVGESGLFAIVLPNQTTVPLPEGWSSAAGERRLASKVTTLGPVLSSSGRSPRSSSGHAHPRIRVDVPALGEHWTVTSTPRIFWSQENVSGPVKIELSTDSGRTFPITIAERATGGSVTWRVPLTVPLSTACRVRVSSVIDPTVSDTSDGDFTITLAGQPTLTLTVPDGQEVYPAGSTQRLRWQVSGDAGATVRVDISLDGGNTFQVLLDNVTNNTDRLWTVPPLPSTRCRIRLVSKQNPLVRDVTNCDFTITGRP